jgi:hypothetical protein
MKIKERKILLHFLKQHLETITEKAEPTQELYFQGLFTREEMLEIIMKYYDEDRDKLLKQENDELEAMILDELVLQYYIEKIEAGITATPQLSKEEIHEFFERTGQQTHYLMDKPLEEWDGYDRSNYYSLLTKHGKTKRVFAIFTSEVEDKDKYAVTTQPSFFFDSQKEAEEDMQRIIDEGKFKEGELKVMSLWQIS